MRIRWTSVPSVTGTTPVVPQAGSGPADRRTPEETADTADKDKPKTERATRKAWDRLFGKGESSK